MSYLQKRAGNEATRGRSRGGSVVISPCNKWRGDVATLEARCCE